MPAVEFKAINAVGVEMEGGWARRPPDTDVYGDGSVTVRNTTHIGEVASQPITEFDALANFIRRNYPSAVNASCGFHIHVSFKNPYHYSLLMSKRFYRHYVRHMKDLVDRIERKIPGAGRALKERLAGRNSYCHVMKGGEPEKQAAVRCKDSIRYHHLNFCWLLHGTVESRLFPMFHDAGLAVACVKDYLTFVEEYITKHSRAERGKVIEKVVTLEPKVVRLK